MTLPTQNHNLFSMMVAKPKGVCFEAQRQGEEVLLVVRRHWVTQVSWIVLVGFLLLAPLLVFPLLYFVLPETFLLRNPLLVTLFTFFWYLVTLFYAFEKALLWFYDITILSSQRLIDVDFYNFFQKHYTEAHLSRVQDVTSMTTGPLQVFFNYGNVHVQTAGELPNIDFEEIPSPDRVSKAVGELVLEFSGNPVGVATGTKN